MSKSPTGTSRKISSHKLARRTNVWWIWIIHHRIEIVAYFSFAAQNILIQKIINWESRNHLKIWHGSREMLQKPSGEEKAHGLGSSHWKWFRRMLFHSRFPRERKLLGLMWTVFVSIPFDSSKTTRERAIKYGGERRLWPLAAIRITSRSNQRKRCGVLSRPGRLHRRDWQIYRHVLVHASILFSTINTLIHRCSYS